MTYATTTHCATEGCQGTPFFGETASPGYCDDCHVARMTAVMRVETICDLLDTEEDEYERADLIDEATDLADRFGGPVADAWKQYR